MSISKIKILFVVSNKLPLELQIDNNTSDCEELIGGKMEVCYLKNNKDDVCLVCNEKYKKYGFKPNRFVSTSFIYGNFVVVGYDDETKKFKSLTKNQIKYYTNYFGKNSITKSNSKIVAHKVVMAMMKRR